MNLALRPATHEALERFRLRRQHLLRMRALLCGGAVALAAFVLIALLDRSWFMPDAARPWLTLGVYAGAVYAAWRLAWRFISLAKGKEGTAKLIEAAEPALHERLLAAVELSKPGEGAGVTDSLEFREKLQDDVAAAVEGIDWTSKLPTRVLKPWFLAVGGVVAVVLALCFVPGLHLPGFLARAALPFANLARPASVKIRILEPAKADALAPIGSEVPLVVETEGAKTQTATLELETPGSKARRSELSSMGTARFEGVVPVGQTDVRYRVHAGDAITPWRTLSARARPRVMSFEKTIVPPKYVEAAETKVTEDHGDLEALDGSTIKLTLKTNQPVTQSDVVINPDLPGKTKSPASPNKDGLLAAEVPVKVENGTWQIALTSQETGFTNEESTPWRITTIPDLPPTAQINEPAEQTELLADEAVRLVGIATDDVGLASVKVTHAINGADWTPHDIALPAKAAKEAPVQSLIPLAPLGVKPGDALLVKIVATDLKGQKTESPAVRVLILEQTVDPRQREWAASQRRLAQRAERLNEQTRELTKDIEKVRKTEKKANKDPNQAKTESDNALAAAQEKLEQVKAQTEELWNAVKDAARDAPNQLDASEAQLLGERLAQLRRESLPTLEKLNSGQIENPEQIKRASHEANSHANALADALRAFSAEESAKIAAQESQQLQRQARMLTETSLAANRDAAQRPKWQEQQRALMAQAKTLQKDMQELGEAQNGRHRGQLQDVDKKIKETAGDLEASLDKADQTKSPEHLYGASDNLRGRLQQAADVTRGIAEQTMHEAQQRREQLARIENPALQKLDEAKNYLAIAEQAARDPKQNKKNDRDGLTPAEKAQEQLAQAAKQLQDQAELREQNQLTNTQAALDMNRASRAADELSRKTEDARKIPLLTQEEAEKARKSNAPPGEAQKALALLKDQASQLTQATRALEADALTQDAAQALQAAQAEAMRPQNQQDVNLTAAQARAASDSLMQITDKINRARLAEDLQKTDPQAANNLRQAAQQAADTARNAAEQNKNLAIQARHLQEPGQQLNVQPAQQATADAQQKANALAALLTPQIDTARAQLLAMTPELSEMMKRVAEDLNKTQQDTQAAADEAKAEKPVELVAEKAEELRPEAAANQEKMAALQAALRQEANAADLKKEGEAALARTADVALAQMQQKSPEIAQNLKQAAQATQSKPQAQALQAAATAQQQTAQALQQIAQNMQKMEQGQQLSEADQAAMQQMEQELGVQAPLDEAYQRAQELAEMAKDASQNPQAVLEALEKELPKNQAMQKALADTAKSTAQQAEKAVAAEAQMAVQNGMAQKQAANDLARVSRHQQRLGQKEAAEKIAQASTEIQKAGQQAEAQQANPQPDVQAKAAQQSQANAASAAKAAETSASQTSPAMMASPLEQLQGQMLAQALDQLDAQLHPMQNGQQQPGQGQQQQQQGQGQQQQQAAQQSLNDAQQAQQQSMADARNSGQTPGNKPGQQQQAKNQQQSQQNGQNASDQGNQSQLVQADGALGQITVLVPSDWGHLPQKMADDLTEATRSEAAPEYRAAIESYYKAIANKAKK